MIVLLPTMVTNKRFSVVGHCPVAIKKVIKKRELWILPLILVLGALIASCFGNKDDKGPVVQASEARFREYVKNLQLDQATLEAENLADLFLSDRKYKEAEHWYSEALNYDPNNRGINILHELTFSLLPFEGMASRASDLEELKPKKHRIAEHEIAVRQGRYSVISPFLLGVPDGKSVFQTHSDLQKALKEEVLPQLKASQLRLKKALVENADALVPVPQYARDPQAQRQTICYGEPGEIQCSGVLIGEFQLDHFDFVIISEMLRASIDAIRLATAFSAEGEEAISREIHRIDVWRAGDAHLIGLSTEGIKREKANAGIKAIQKQKAFGKLTGGHEIAEMIHTIPETLRAALSLDALKAELCGTETRRFESKALFGSICLGQNGLSNLTRNLELFKGPTEVLMFNNQGQKEKTTLDIVSFLRNPPQDLKTLLPTEYEVERKPWPHLPEQVCKIKSLNDPTLGGLFPNGDAEKFIETLIKWLIGEGLYKNPIVEIHLKR